MICLRCSEAMAGGLKLRTWEATPMRRAKFFTRFTNSPCLRIPRLINEGLRFYCRPKVRTDRGTFGVVPRLYNLTLKADSLTDATSGYLPPEPRGRRLVSLMLFQVRKRWRGHSGASAKT